MDEVIAFVEGLGGVLTLRPQPGDGSPEVSWGDAFLYHAPDGIVPRTHSATCSGRRTPSRRPATSAAAGRSRTDPTVL